MQPDRCPTCRAPLPEAKVCASETCTNVFYRGEGGRTDAMFCTDRCGNAQAQRDYRARQGKGRLGR